MPGAVIGARCNLGQNVVVMPGTRLGNNVKIQNNVSIYEGVELEDDVFCGPSCVFTNVANPRSHVSRKSEYQPDPGPPGRHHRRQRHHRLRRHPGRIQLHRRRRRGHQRRPDYALMVGVPARRVGWMCQCGVRLRSGEGRAALRRLRGRLPGVGRPPPPD